MDEPDARASADIMDDQVELENRPEIRQALREIGIDDGPRGHLRLGVRKGISFLVLIALFVTALALRAVDLAEWMTVQTRYADALDRVLLGVAIFSGLILVTKSIDEFVLSHIEDDASKFNLRRILRLLLGIGLGFVALSLVFANWYTALISFGLLSLVLGFALQTPITSFVGWVYILIRAPYRVGDRIKIGEATGDVIDVGYLDTTLWEFGGQYLSTDHPSGRIIKFPNSNVLTSAVYNYSWPLFPYIWNEVRFNIAYGSDLDFVAKTMEDVATNEIGSAMTDRIARYRELLSQTPVDEIQVGEKPVVLFRVNDNTWLEAIVRYLVDPKEAGRVKTKLIRHMLTRMNEEPDRVLFPRSDAR